MKLDHQLTPYTKINSRIKDLNISYETIKLLEENIGRKVSYVLCINIFTNMSPRERDIKERTNKWDFTKIKSFCTAKEISKMKREPTVWKNIFANDTSDKGSPKYIKNSYDSTPGRQTIQLKSGQRT